MRREQPVVLGFTGTRRGLTPEQRKMLKAYLKIIWLAKDDVTIHHGDCIGADCHAHELALDFSFNVVVHPPLNERYRAHCTPGLVLPQRGYLERNDDIVAACEELVACPAQAHEVKRSGTWYTIRKAKREGKVVYIIKPDGSTKAYSKGRTKE